MNANETTLHKRQNDTEINNFRSATMSKPHTAYSKL